MKNYQLITKLENKPVGWVRHVSVHAERAAQLVRRT